MELHCPFQSLDWLDGETQDNDSTETGSSSRRPGLGSQVHWKERKNSQVFMSGYFVPFYLQERRKLCSSTKEIEMEIVMGGGQCHGRGRREEKMLG